MACADGGLLVLSGGYSADHPVIRVFWRVVEGFTDEEKRKLLKFVTSCSRPPLLGFKVRPLCVRSESPGGRRWDSPWALWGGWGVGGAFAVCPSR